MEYSVNLATFQGPFDLLFYLIEKKEVDIYDIPISEITEQYMEYLKEMKNLNLNITSEFILMAATLLEIKSQMLLPIKEKEEDDPRLLLVNQLLEYKLCRLASEKLKEFESENKYFFNKPKEEIEVENIEDHIQLSISAVNAHELYLIFSELLKQKNIQIEKEPAFVEKIYRESYSVKECSDDILKKLKSNRKVSVFALFDDFSNVTNKREYVVSIFLAILELSKNKEIRIVQNNSFNDIEIYYEENGESDE